MAKAEVFVDGNLQAPVTVPAAGVIVGRAPEWSNDAHLLRVDNQSVSRNHLRLYWQGEELWVEDLDSTKGTWRRGEQLRIPMRLADRDELALASGAGSVVLQVRLYDIGFGQPLASLHDTSGELSPSDARPSTPSAHGLLADLPRLYRVAAREELAVETARILCARLPASRATVLEFEPNQPHKTRILGASPRDAGRYVSRTVVDEAIHRGWACHVRSPGSSETFLASQATSAVAVAARSPDEQTYVFYADTTSEQPPLGWEPAGQLSEVAPLLAAAFGGLRIRELHATRELGYEYLRRYVGTPVANQLIAGGQGMVEEPQEVPASVMFADLSGYTALTFSMRADLKRLVGLLNDWLKIGIDAVLRHGGTLDKFIGDAVMGIFGAPVRVSAGPLQAVDCAVTIRRDLRRWAPSVGHPSFTMTCGIASGLVIAGSIGTERRREWTVLGDTVNVAARLQGEVARGGKIVIDEATQREVRGDFNLRPIGEVTLRNRADPVRVWEVLDGLD